MAAAAAKGDLAALRAQALFIEPEVQRIAFQARKLQEIRIESDSNARNKEVPEVWKEEKP